MSLASPTRQVESSSESRSARHVATVCQLLHSLNVGGAEVLAARFARYLNGPFRFVFACLDDIGTLGDQLRAEGFAIAGLQRRPGLDWECASRLRRLLHQEQVDLIHAHQYTPFFYALLARRFRRRPPILFTEHGRFHPDCRSAKRVAFNRLMLRRGDRLVAVGQAVRQALIENEGLRPARVRVVYNGIDLARYTHLTVDRAEVRRGIGVGRDDLMLIHVARLDPIKDHALAVRAMQRVIASRPDAKLVLVGEGPEMPAVEQQVRSAGLQDAVRLLGLRHDVPELLAAADIFLLTSFSEGIPLTIIEAMAAGLPVIATRVGGVEEMVVEGATGLLVPSGNDQALAAAIERLAGDPQTRHVYGAAGRRRAETDFDEQQMHEQYGRLYAEMIG